MSSFMTYRHILVSPYSNYYIDYTKYGGIPNPIGFFIYFCSSQGGAYDAYLWLGYANGTTRSKIICLSSSQATTFNAFIPDSGVDSHFLEVNTIRTLSVAAHSIIIIDIGNKSSHNYWTITEKV